MNDERRSNRDAFQGKCDCCSYKTRSGIVLSEEGRSERLGNASHWHIKISILPATAPMGTILTGQRVMPLIIFLTNYRRAQNRQKSHFFQVQAEGETFLSRTATADETWVHYLKLYAPDGICSQRRKTRRINDGQMRSKRGRFRVIKVEHWHYACLLDNSCLFVGVLTLSQPYYVATVAYRKFFYNLLVVYWSVRTSTETKTSWIRRSVTLAKMAWRERTNYGSCQDNGCVGRESRQTSSESKTRQPTEGCEPHTFHTQTCNSSRTTFRHYKQGLELTNTTRSRPYQLQFPRGLRPR